MKKKPDVELRQLQISVISLIGHLQEGVDHLDTLVCKTIARALAEIVQEVESFPEDVSPDDIAAFTRDVLVATDELQRALEARWSDELQPLMERAYERAEDLEHDLADFTCLSVNGEEWGAICISCMQWVYVRPDEISGAVLTRCPGWKGRYQI